MFYSVAMGLPEMILFRKDQRVAREPEPDQTEPDQ